MTEYERTEAGSPRMPCSVCGRLTALRADGMVMRHGDQNESAEWPPMTCMGWGLPPRQDES